MCGIVAILLQPQARPEQVWAELRATFTANLVANAVRGRAATGLGVIQRSGQALVHKVDIEAEKFVETGGYHDLLGTVNAETVVILGHTRLPTQGSPLNPHNNHPITVGPVVGVHNGHIANDDELFARRALPRIAQVDSEIIFQLLALHSPDSAADDYLSLIGQDITQLRGPCTFLAVDRRRPQRLLAFKHENPLCLHYHAGWRALFFSSEYLFLRRTFGRSVITEELGNDQLTYFDATQMPQPIARHCPLPARPPRAGSILD